MLRKKSLNINTVALLFGYCKDVVSYCCLISVLFYIQFEKGKLISTEKTAVRFQAVAKQKRSGRFFVCERRSFSSLNRCGDVCLFVF